MKEEDMRAKRKRLIRFLPLYLMALPGLTYVFINNYMPMFGVVIAFKDLDFRKGIFGSDWAGFKNFEYLFRTNDAFVITRNTILYNIMFMIVGTALSITVGILLNEIRNKLALRIYQSLILIPFLISMVIVSYLVFALLSTETGLINNSILKPLGMEPVSWYTEKGYWPFILLIVNQWKGIGFSSVVYLSTIVGISAEYYEAARIDGASKWQQIKRITLPLLKPTVITLTILSIGRIFYSDFGLFYQVPRNSGVLYEVTRTIDVYVYNALMNNADYTMSSAASVYQSFVGFVLIITANIVIGKISKEDALF
jgi:putative aldouronate transport system permease protein